LGLFLMACPDGHHVDHKWPLCKGGIDEQRSGSVGHVVAAVGQKLALFEIRFPKPLLMPTLRELDLIFGTLWQQFRVILNVKQRPFLAGIRRGIARKRCSQQWKICEP
ncbi:MAG: hypothetical protein VW076_05585, partial [Synechococcus sp.]